MEDIELLEMRARRGDLLFLMAKLEAQRSDATGQVNALTKSITERTAQQQERVMNPIVGDPVHYYPTAPEEGQFGEGPLAAIVAKHLGGQVCNLGCLTGTGGTFARQSVSFSATPAAGMWSPKR